MLSGWKVLEIWDLSKNQEKIQFILFVVPRMQCQLVEKDLSKIETV